MPCKGACSNQSCSRNWSYPVWYGSYSCGSTITGYAVDVEQLTLCQKKTATGTNWTEGSLDPRASLTLGRAVACTRNQTMLTA